MLGCGPDLIMVRSGCFLGLLACVRGRFCVWCRAAKRQQQCAFCAVYMTATTTATANANDQQQQQPADAPGLSGFWQRGADDDCERGFVAPACRMISFLLRTYVHTV